MTVQQAAKKLGWSELFLREAIAQKQVDFGICVQMPGSSRRTFKVNEGRLETWIRGNGSQSGLGSV